MSRAPWRGMKSDGVDDLFDVHTNFARQENAGKSIGHQWSATNSATILPCVRSSFMPKELVGHHLLRVRIRKSIFDKLQDTADEETSRTGEHVTVSDLVRAACYNYLLIHDAVQRMENSPPDMEDEILIITSPTL